MTPPDPDTPLAEAAVELGARLYAARLRRGALLSVIGDPHPRVRRAVETWARGIAQREGGP